MESKHVVAARDPLTAVPSLARSHAVAWVVLEGPDRRRHTLGVGDLIGRLPGAALMIDDPRISEAHAIVSLRAGGLHLLSLRRMVAVAGRPMSEVALRPRMVLELAPGVTFSVVEVHLPDQVMAIRIRGHGPRPLPPCASLLADPLRLAPRFVPDAPVHLWEADQVWRVRCGDGAARPLVVGEVLEVGAARAEIMTMSLFELQALQTDAGVGVFDPLRLIAHYDVVELHRAGREPVVVGGLGAQIISELVACRGPMSWTSLAATLWPGNHDGLDLRHRWDVALHRLRTKLRDAGIRGDLLRSDHSGQLTLVLYDGDTVHDRT